MTYLLIVFPLVMAAVTFAVPSNRWRPWLLARRGAGAPWPGLLWLVSGPEQARHCLGLGGWLLARSRWARSSSAS